MSTPSFIAIFTHTQILVHLYGVTFLTERSYGEPAITGHFMRSMVGPLKKGPYQGLPFSTSEFDK